MLCSVGIAFAEELGKLCPHISIIIFFLLPNLRGWLLDAIWFVIRVALWRTIRIAFGELLGLLYVELLGLLYGELLELLLANY